MGVTATASYKYDGNSKHLAINLTCNEGESDIWIFVPSMGTKDGKTKTKEELFELSKKIFNRNLFTILVALGYKPEALTEKFGEVSDPKTLIHNVSGLINKAKDNDKKINIKLMLSNSGYTGFGETAFAEPFVEGEPTKLTWTDRELGFIKTRKPKSKQGDKTETFGSNNNMDDLLSAESSNDADVSLMDFGNMGSDFDL